MPIRIKNAIILAAGKGDRLEELGQKFPKGFLTFGKKPIIEESIIKLLDSGIENIIIVSGFLSEFYDRLAKKYACIKIIKNKKYADLGSMFSFYCAKEYVNKDFILLESDLIYEKKALDAVLSFPKKNCILASGKTNSGDEVYIECREDRIYDLSKNINELQNISGEFVGISKISSRLARKMIDEYKSVSKKKLNVEYETDCISSVAKKINIYLNKVNNLIWAEIDDKNHLKRAKNIIYPKIIKKDKEVYKRCLML